MEKSNILSEIKGWFGKIKCCGLVLPDGWFGRPYDNQYMLENIFYDKGELVVRLSGNTTLNFSGKVKLVSDKEGLAVENFVKLEINWKYGDEAEMNKKIFNSGRVLFAVIPGGRKD